MDYISFMIKPKLYNNSILRTRHVNVHWFLNKWRQFAIRVWSISTTFSSQPRGFKSQFVAFYFLFLVFFYPYFSFLFNRAPSLAFWYQRATSKEMKRGSEFFISFRREPQKRRCEEKRGGKKTLHSEIRALYYVPLHKKTKKKKKRRAEKISKKGSARLTRLDLTWLPFILCAQDFFLSFSDLTGLLIQGFATQLLSLYLTISIWPHLFCQQELSLFFPV